MDKTCNACGEALPLDDDHWYWRTTPSGTRVTQGGKCKACTKLAQQAKPKSPRTSAQRERENAARRAKRVAAGATPRVIPFPAILRRDWSPNAATPVQDQARAAQVVAEALAEVRRGRSTKPAAGGS